MAKKKQDRWPKYKREQCKDLMRAGLAPRQIAAETEIPYDTIIKWVRAEYEAMPKLTRASIAKRLQWMSENADNQRQALAAIRELDKFMPPDEPEANVNTADRMREAADASKRAAEDRAANSKPARPDTGSSDGERSGS